MKITKTKLKKLLNIKLIKLGYLELKDSISGAQGLYLKPMKNSLYLTLGLIISRYHESLFTGSFYISKTTRWGSVWGDIPKASYVRISNLLTPAERNTLLGEDYRKEGIKDGWWDAADLNSLNDFLNSLKISEQRLLKNTILLKEIDKSNDIIELSNAAKLVIEKIKSSDFNDNFQFIPLREIDDTPIVWFKAAEMVIKKTNIPLNKNTVKLLAIDAYRLYMLG